MLSSCHEASGELQWKQLCHMILTVLFFVMQHFMEEHLKKRHISLRQWACEQCEVTAPLDLAAFAVLRNVFKVRFYKDTVAQGLFYASNNRRRDRK